MMGLSADVLATLALSGFCGGAGAYMALRVEMARIQVLARLAGESADKAHDRIDKLIARG